MTDIVLVRHAETVWHADNRYAGRTDVALTQRGKDQAEQLADWSGRAGLAACFSSPLTRARETLAPAVRTTGLVMQVDARLVELDFGDGEGLTAEEMRASFPAARAAFERDPVNNPLPGGESATAAITRVTACLSEIAETYPGQRVLVVLHSTVIRLVLCSLLGIQPARYRQVFPSLRNTGLTEIRLAGDVCALLHYNTPATRNYRP